MILKTFLVDEHTIDFANLGENLHMLQAILLQCLKPKTRLFDFLDVVRLGNFALIKVSRMFLGRVQQIIGG